MGKQSRYANVNKAVEKTSCLYNPALMPTSSGNGIEAFPQANKPGSGGAAGAHWIKQQRLEKEADKAEKAKAKEDYEKLKTDFKNREKNNPDSILHMANYRRELDRARNEKLASGVNHKELKKEKKSKKDKKDKKKSKKKEKKRKKDSDSSSSDEGTSAKRSKKTVESGGYGQSGISLASAFFAGDSDSD